MDTQQALLRAILLNPADDVARLVYADWLDEGAATVPCPKCKGRGDDGGDAYDRGMVGICPACSGTGTVACERAARAEFIRLQCELARSESLPGITQTQLALAARTAELLTEHGREWAHVVCPTCKGTGKCDGFFVGQYPCSECSPNDAQASLAALMWDQLEPDGTGDAMQRHGVQSEFRRGFVDSVKVPRPEWVFEQRYQGHAAGRPVQPDDTLNPTEWSVTEWAKAIAQAHPVTRWVFPFQVEHVGAGAVFVPTTANLPDPLVDELVADPRAVGRTTLFMKESNLLDALALAAGRVVRRAAGFAG
jgi:uncharacterized protein (TIGR02996 family)